MSSPKDEIYDDYDKPSDEEWVKIETFARLVGCMYKVAVELFEGGYSTSNVYFYLLAELKVMLEKELAGADSDYFRCNAKWMLKRFDKYWDHMFLVLATASVLDPRFKMTYLEFYCSKKIDNDEGSKAETVLGYLRKMRKKLKLDDHEEEVDYSRPSPADPEKEAFNALARFFVRSGVNPNTIETPSFTDLMRLLNPNFRPTVSILQKEVLEIHQECKEKAKDFLKSFQGKLTLSYEWIVLGHGWTRDSVKGPVLHEDFVCITAHLVDDDWKVRRWILGYASEVDVVALDDLYVHGFRKAVQGFEIEGKVSTLLLPNEEGFDEETLGGFRRGLEERGDSSIAPPVFLVYCCADLFRLMVHDVFNDFSGKLLEDLRMIVGWGKCSSENWNLWVSNLQRAVDMKNEDEFSKDEIYDDYDKPSDEEWVKIETFARLVGCMYKVAVELFEGGYSTSNVYFYLLAELKNEDEFSKDEIYDDYDKPSDEEWVKIETFARLVGCMYKVAVELFEGGYSTSNVYFYLLAELKVMLEKELEGADSDYFRCNAKWMLKRFDKYWDHMFLVLATASVLDPRFKMKYLEFYCSKNKVCDEASKAETVLDYLRSLYARYAASDICQKPICSVAKVDSKEEGENGDGGGEEDHDEIQDGEEDYDEEQGENEEDYDEELGEGEEDCEDDEEEEYDEEEDGEEKYDSDSSEEAEREARKTREKKTDACKDFAFFQEFLKFEGSAREFGEPELDCYLREPVMEWNKDFKALDWWREEGHKYPVLSRVSRDILSIPISRATSYYAYGMDRREPPAFVVSLEAEVANAMMCSKKWLRL
ncbi:hypothetical protein F2Q68_00017501 [Brassica cretica]|uniref:hAT-like transposase RNase-H fold domain-containing protein n=1 Tax=Brassica cretica TaxID=69181 RepID=A0A8S9HE24_BRACR|nr:hypothetical protein F2Q68_00017501 [Brassica cretica]